MYARTHPRLAERHEQNVDVILQLLVAGQQLVLDEANTVRAQGLVVNADVQLCEND